MDFKQAREAAGLTLEQLAERARYSIAAINGLENHGEGSPRLKAKLTEILSGSSADGAPALHEGEDLRADRDLWMRRAKKAEADLHKLKTKLRALLEAE